jgi:hypothetical protein
MTTSELAVGLGGWGFATVMVVVFWISIRHG